MLNPDGVRYGNYRCCLFGCDLNRKWRKTHHLMHFPVNFVKKTLSDIQKDREIALFCDIHGHSRSRDVFIYGCSFQKEDELQKSNQIK